MLKLQPFYLSSQKNPVNHVKGIRKSKTFLPTSFPAYIPTFLLQVSSAKLLCHLCDKSIETGLFLVFSIPLVRLVVFAVTGDLRRMYVYSKWYGIGESTRVTAVPLPPSLSLSSYLSSAFPGITLHLTLTINLPYFPRDVCLNSASSLVSMAGCS